MKSVIIIGGVFLTLLLTACSAVEESSKFAEAERLAEEANKQKALEFYRPGITIEERDAAEVTHIGGVGIAPEGVAVYNPAFDVTPHRYITGIVTEEGIITPPFGPGLRRAKALRYAAASSDDVAAASLTGYSGQGVPDEEI